jgi:hypothetical protein
MAKDEPPNEPGEKKIETDAEAAGVHEHDKRRRHGYRGYPNNPDVAPVHHGTGFAGVGSTSGPAAGSGSVFTDTSTESVEELGNEEEEENE